MVQAIRDTARQRPLPIPQHHPAHHRQLGGDDVDKQSKTLPGNGRFPSHNVTRRTTYSLGEYGRCPSHSLHRFHYQRPLPGVPTFTNCTA